MALDLGGRPHKPVKRCRKRRLTCRTTARARDPPFRCGLAPGLPTTRGEIGARRSTSLRPAQPSSTGALMPSPSSGGITRQARRSLPASYASSPEPGDLPCLVPSAPTRATIREEKHSCDIRLRSRLALRFCSGSPLLRLLRNPARPPPADRRPSTRPARRETRPSLAAPSLAVPSLAVRRRTCSGR